MTDSFASSSGTTFRDRGDLAGAADSLRDCWQTLERRTGERPGVYLGWALLLGFTLQVLPIRFMIWALLRLVVFLLKPVLLACGVWKLYEIVAQSQRA
jgi:hypothetical protein